MQMVAAYLATGICASMRTGLLVRDALNLSHSYCSVSACYYNDCSYHLIVSSPFVTSPAAAAAVRCEWIYCAADANRRNKLLSVGRPQLHLSDDADLCASFLSTVDYWYCRSAPDCIDSAAAATTHPRQWTMLLMYSRPSAPSAASFCCLVIIAIKRSVNSE